MSIQSYRDQIYAGVLGKIIGVYMGRPVEGWTYDAIRSQFDEVNYYISHKVGAPFIVPDDDISGTFVFYRALEDSNYAKDLTATQIGEAWLNYIVEDKTVLWWGGMARSTEHSAYLRLKAGIQPPFSGSSEYNGKAIAEQIGSQIFIDTWALTNPGNPELAAKMAREACLVSHDGIAIEAAVYLAAMEAMAFDTKDVDELLKKGRTYIADNEYGKQLNQLLDDVIEQCEKTSDWRQVRDWIEENHNYAKYQGNCPMVPNHLSIIMALKMAGDDFRKSLAIAVSAGWDTDCNAANVGCLNAIRLGLDSINAQVDLRGPVADRMYIVSTDGADCIFDAVRETRKILKAAAALAGETIELPKNKYEFEFPGSTQGFMLHPALTFGQAAKRVNNAYATTGAPGLLVQFEGVSKGVTAAVSVQTFVDPTPKAAADTSYFEVYASPSLYSSQVVTANFYSETAQNPDVRFFIDYYNGNDEIATITGPERFAIAQGNNQISWTIPETNGRAVYRLGFELVSDTRKDGEICLKTLDWTGAPTYFHMGTSQELTPGLSPFVTRTKWMTSFMSTAKHMGPDHLATFAVSHPEDNGVMTIGGADWSDYSLESDIQFVHAKCGGMVARSKGHRRYYAGVFMGGKYAIIKRCGAEVTILAQSETGYAEGDWHNVKFQVRGNQIALFIDGSKTVSCTDNSYTCGAAGYMVDEGAFVAKTFTVKAL